MSADSPSNFFGRPRNPPTAVHRYRPTFHSAGLNGLVFGGLGAGLVAMAIDCAYRQNLRGAAAMALFALLLAAWLSYVLTVRVVIDDRTLVRTWMFGRRFVVLDAITQLGLVPYKGSVSLVIRSGRWRQLSLSSDAFDWQDVRCMHRDILLALGLDTEPMWPTAPRWVGMLDVAAVLRYRRFQQEREDAGGGGA